MWTDFRNTLDGAGTPHTGISPPAGLAGCPLCLRRLTAFSGRFNARAETGQSYLPDMRVIASRPATACLGADGCSPYTSLLKVGSWPAQLPHGFPLGRISDVSNGPIQLSGCRQPAQARREISGLVPVGGWRQISPHFEGHFSKIIIFQQATFFAHFACF